MRIYEEQKYEHALFEVYVAEKETYILALFNSDTTDPRDGLHPKLKHGLPTLLLASALL